MYNSLSNYLGREKTIFRVGKRRLFRSAFVWSICCCAVLVCASPNESTAQAPPSASATSNSTPANQPLAYTGDARNTVSGKPILSFNKTTKKLVIENIGVPGAKNIPRIDAKTVPSNSNLGVKFSQMPIASYYWHFIIDVSGGSSRNTTVQTEINTAAQIISVLPEQDAITVYGLGASTEKWFSSPPNDPSRKILHEQLLSRSKNKKFSESPQFRQSSLIFTNTLSILASDEVLSNKGNTALVLVSDGVDETGGNDAKQHEAQNSIKNKLIETAKKNQIPIYTLAFAHNNEALRQGFPHLQHIAQDTQGKYWQYTGTAQPEKNKPEEKLIASAHPCRIHLEIALPNEAEEIQVTLNGNNNQSGVLYIPASIIQNFMEGKLPPDTDIPITDNDSPIIEGQPTPESTPKQPVVEEGLSAYLWYIVGGVLLLIVIIGIVIATRKKKPFAIPDPVPDNNPPKTPSSSYETIPPGDPLPEPPTVNPTVMNAPVLCRLENVKTGQIWEIRLPSTSIGRNTNNNICIQDQSVSSFHCILKQGRDKQWSLTDVGSSNGLYFKGKTYRKESIQLVDGDIVELGDVTLRLRTIF